MINSRFVTKKFDLFFILLNILFIFLIFQIFPHSSQIRYAKMFGFIFTASKSRSRQTLAIFMSNP